MALANLVRNLGSWSGLFVARSALFVIVPLALIACTSKTGDSKSDGGRQFDPDKYAAVPGPAYRLPVDAGERAFLCLAAATDAQDSLAESDVAGRLHAQLREMQWANIAVHVNGPVENPGFAASQLAGRARAALRDQPSRFRLRQLGLACPEAFPQTRDTSELPLPAAESDAATVCYFMVDAITQLDDGTPERLAEISKILGENGAMMPQLQPLVRSALRSNGIDSEAKLFSFGDIALRRAYAIAPPETLLRKCRVRFG